MGFAKNNFRWRQNTPIHEGKKIKRELLPIILFKNGKPIKLKAVSKLRPKVQYSGDKEQ